MKQNYPASDPEKAIHFNDARRDLDSLMDVMMDGMVLIPAWAPAAELIWSQLHGMTPVLPKILLL